MSDNFKETSIDYLTCDNHAVFYSGETKWINKMRRYAEQYPNEVRIQQDNDWGLIAHVPRNWMKVAPPRKVNLTEEQRRQRAARLAASRSNNG